MPALRSTTNNSRQPRCPPASEFFKTDTKQARALNACEGIVVLFSPAPHWECDQLHKLSKAVSDRGIAVVTNNRMRNSRKFAHRKLIVVEPTNSDLDPADNNANTTHMAPCDFIDWVNLLEAERGLYLSLKAKVPKGGLKGDWIEIGNWGNKAERMIQILDLKDQTNLFNFNVRRQWVTKTQHDVKMLSPSPEPQPGPQFAADIVMRSPSPDFEAPGEDGDVRMRSPSPELNHQLAFHLPLPEYPIQHPVDANGDIELPAVRAPAARRPAAVRRIWDLRFEAANQPEEYRWVD